MVRTLAKHTTKTGLDILVLVVAFGLAFVIRFDGDIPAKYWKQLVVFWPYVVMVQYGLLAICGVTRYSWRYVGLRESLRVLLAVSASVALLVMLRLIAPWLWKSNPHLYNLGIPLGVAAMDCVLAFLGIIGVRVLTRLIHEKRGQLRHRNQSNQQIPTLLLGAGDTGLSVAKEIQSRPDLGIKPLGFLDDDPLIRNSTIHGLRVLGRIVDTKRIAKRLGAKQVLIAMPHASGTEVRRIKELCQEAEISTKIIPGLGDIVEGKASLTLIREVAIEDLLRREPVVLDERAVAELVRNHVVMVTGAGGAIGSELCRQICRYSPPRLILVEQYENGLFDIHRNLEELFPKVTTLPAIADICDAKRIESLLSTHKPKIVFHAAAHKHVPMMEWNPGEAIKNNIVGTQNLADLSRKNGVDRFILISSDKAVNPTSIMGTSKRVAELYLQSMSKDSSTRFSAVRFGNVMGSTGSVIPIFKEQIAKGGPITVTDPQMKRYFMTIPEACRLVLQAAALGKGGEVFVLDMGQPMRIIDLAHDLIRLSGLVPDEDIEVRITGIRPGEKLFEELSTDHEHNDRTSHPSIFTLKSTPPDPCGLRMRLTELTSSVDDVDCDALRAMLVSLIPEGENCRVLPNAEVPEPQGLQDRQSSTADSSGQSAHRGLRTTLPSPQKP